MRSFDDVRRVVVKVGTNILTKDDQLDTAYIAQLAEQIALLMHEGREVCLVSSGAIGLGSRVTGERGRVTDVVLRQAYAAIGQPLLMEVYRTAFTSHHIRTAQVLLTREALDDRKSYVRLRNTVERLLEMGVLPIINENDCVATAEIGTAFGDNDQLSALIASKVDASLLVILSDIDGFYSADPRRDESAERYHEVRTLTDGMLTAAGKPGSALGTGGMATKLKAVQIAADGDCRVVLAHGHTPEVLSRILRGEEVGTVFGTRRNLKNRTRWLLHSAPKGAITVDEGALLAIRAHNSLLPTGIVAVEGTFEAGDVVRVNNSAKLITSFSSDELHAVIGHHSAEIPRLLGQRTSRHVIARPEDMVFFEDE